MKNNQKGLTLIEMMIAMIIGLLVVGTVITIFITNVRSNRDNVAMIKLNQELRGVMTFMSDEIKRAGYSADPDEDDFILDFDTSTANCISYAYDEDASGSLENDEQFGFKGIDTNSDGVVDTIQWGRNNTNDDCAAGDWESITDIEILEITSVNVVPATISAPSATIQQLTITIEGQTSLSDGTPASRAITEVIRVRNDNA